MNLGITAKTNFYHSNGTGILKSPFSLLFAFFTGRDGYIIDNSGGLTHTRRPNSAANDSSRYMKFGLRQIPNYSASAKVVHYGSDGSGRDNYIMFVFLKIIILVFL